ncbi:MAG: flagellar export chaperone FliS [Desulfovibrio sp.]|jgi:flagellar protein FliS|nr:flagellar export chaperone FliS [Desulfovibrio sp.]
MQQVAKSYARTQITTTSQGDLVIMLYDAALKFVGQAKERLAEGDMAKKGIAISKALDILNELSASLNVTRGGDLALNLSSLYCFCTNHLVKANIKKDPAMLDEVCKILLSLRNAYAEIAVLPEARAAAAEAASNRRPDAVLAPRAAAGLSPSGATTSLPAAGALRQTKLYADICRKFEPVAAP